MLLNLGILTGWIQDTPAAESVRITSRMMLPQMSTGSGYTFQFTATGKPDSLEWKLLTPVPASKDWEGWTLEPNGRLTGKPIPSAPCEPASGCAEGFICRSGKRCEGVMSFNVIVSNRSGGFDQRVFDLVITDPANPLEVGSFATLTAGAVRQAYEAQLYARGGTAPFSWAKSKGSLPPGLALDRSGVLSGTPSSAGSFTWTVEVTDSASKKASSALSLRIDDLSKPITFTPATNVVIRATTPRIGLNVLDDVVHWTDSRITNQYVDNPGLEPQAPYRRMYLAWSGSANTLEEHYFAQFQEVKELNTGFWDGGRYWILSGPSKGRQGRIAKYERVPDKSIAGGFRAVWTLADSDPSRVVEKKTDQNDLDKNIFMVETPPMNGTDPSGFKGSLPPGWWPLANENTTFSVETAKPASGSQSLKIISTGDGVSGINSVISHTNPWRRLRKDTTYRYSVDLRQSGVKDGRVTVQIAPPFSISERLLVQNPKVPDDGKFHRITGEFKGNGQASFGLQIFLEKKGTLWVDNASLYEAVSTKAPAGVPANERISVKMYDFLPFIVDDLRALKVGCLRFWYHDHFLPLQSALTAASESAPGPGHNLFANLKLAETVGSNAWIIAAKEWLPSEFAQLAEYLSSADTSKGMGKLRAEQGHPAPWTDTIGRIYIEYVDEAWNYPDFAYPFDLWHPTKYASFAKERFDAIRASKYHSPKITLVLSGQLADDYWVNDPVDKLTYPSHDAMDAAPYMDAFTSMSTPLNELSATVLEQDVGHTKTLVGTMKIWASRGERTKMLVYEGGPGPLHPIPSTGDEVRKNSMILASLSLDSIADLFANGIGEYNVFTYQNNVGWQVITGASSRFRLPIWYAMSMFNRACGDREQVETKAGPTMPVLRGIGYDKDGNRIAGTALPAISVRSYLKKDRKSFLLINRNPLVEYPVTLQTQDNDVSYRVTTLAASGGERGTLEGPGLLPAEPAERDLSKIFEAVQPRDVNVKSAQGSVRITLPPTSIVTVMSGID